MAIDNAVEELFTGTMVGRVDLEESTVRDTLPRLDPAVIIRGDDGRFVGILLSRNGFVKRDGEAGENGYVPMEGHRIAVKLGNRMPVLREEVLELGPQGIYMDFFDVPMRPYSSD